MTSVEDCPRRLEATFATLADGTIVIHAPGGDVSLNETAGAIWLVCDGRTAMREIIEASQQLFNDSQQQIADDIFAVVDQLRAAGVLHDSDFKS